MDIGNLIAFGLLVLLLPHLFYLHSYAINEYKKDDGKKSLTYWLTVVIIVASDILAIFTSVKIVTSNLQ